MGSFGLKYEMHNNEQSIDHIIIIIIIICYSFNY